MKTLEIPSDVQGGSLPRLVRRFTHSRRLDFQPPKLCGCGSLLTVIDHRCPWYEPTARREWRYEVTCDSCLQCDADGYATRLEVQEAYSANDPKLSDRRSWRGLCAVGVALLVGMEAQAVTAEPVRCSAWLAESFMLDGLDKKQLRLPVKRSGEKLLEVSGRSCRFEKRGDFDEVFLKGFLGVLLNELVELDPSVRTVAHMPLPSPLQFGGEVVVERLVDESVCPLADPARRVAHALELGTVEAKQRDVEIARKCAPPRVRDRIEGVVNRSKPVSGVPEREDELQAKVFGGLRGAGNREEKCNVVEVEVGELFGSASSFDFPDFKSEYSKLPELVAVTVDETAEALMLNAKQTRDIARVRSQL